MSVSNANKTVSPGVLDCTGRTTVTLSFDAEPELKTVPADLVLIMDRSGSMRGVPMEKAKLAAGDMIAAVARASGNAQGTTLENGSAMGLVSFADTAAVDLELSGNVGELNRAVDALTGGGLTNHADALQKGYDTVMKGSNTRKVLILFTDGNSTIGDADPVAEKIRGDGVEIFCIGLATDPGTLNRWATDPDSIHVSYTDDVNQLNQVFAQITSEVVRSGILDGVIQEVLNPDFQIKQVLDSNYGTVTVTDGQHLTWKLYTATLPTPDTLTLSFEICHVGSAGGVKPVNASLIYRDRAENQLVFPSPEVEVSCENSAVVAEPCPAPATFSVEGCRDFGIVQANETALSGLGRIVQVDAVIKNVCPGKRLAAAVMLTEVDDNGVEHTRGTKTLLIPAQTGTRCQDLQLKCIQFVVPEALDPVGDPLSICGKRDFRVRVSANYVDSDFTCCDPETVLI